MARRLSDEDVEAVVTALEKKQGHTCRFDQVRAVDLEEAVRFYKNVNDIIEDSKITFRKAILWGVIVLLGAIFGKGLVVWCRQQLGL